MIKEENKMSICEQTAKCAVELLKEKNLKLALAESCTGGLAAKLITDVSGSSQVFDGGVVSYSNSVKANVLGVEEDMLIRYGAVSCPVAVEMAMGALKLIESDIAVAITGIAGPNSDSTNKPVGLVYIALCDKHGVTVKELRNDYQGDGVREKNREASAAEALSLVKQYAEAYPEKTGLEQDPTELLDRYRSERRDKDGNI